MPKTCKHEQCNNNVFGGGYCSFHQFLRPKKVRSKKVERVQRVVKAKKLRPISKKQSRLISQYTALRKEFFSGIPLLCAANLSSCTKMATDVHHKKGRGKYLLDTITWLPVCRNCHHWIEEHPKEAKELNLSQSRLNQ
jgi:hypothetical protein